MVEAWDDGETASSSESQHHSPWPLLPRSARCILASAQVDSIVVESDQTLSILLFWFPSSLVSPSHHHTPPQQDSRIHSTARQEEASILDRMYA